jgi:hypothetical protein
LEAQAVATQRYLLDQHGGIVRTCIVNEDEVASRQGGRVVFQTEQDVTDIISDVKAKGDVDQSKRTFRHVGTIPAAVIEQATREGWLHDKARWKAWLNDADNRAFRVPGTGRV